MGYWDSPEEALAGQEVDRNFQPQMAAEEREALYEDWKRAVKRSMGWVQG